MSRQEQIIIVFLLIIIVVGGGISYHKRVVRDVINVGVREATADRKESGALIKVDVSGAVRHPGVYELVPGARLEDVLKRAVLCDDADRESINQASFLRDGEKVIIPSVVLQREKDVPVSATYRIRTTIPRSRSASNRTASRKKGYRTLSSSSRVININLATKKELESLPGIGSVRAQRIIDYRRTHGYFRRKEELKKVNGIGEKTYQMVEDSITVK